MNLASTLKDIDFLSISHDFTLKEAPERHPKKASQKGINFIDIDMSSIGGVAAQASKWPLATSKSQPPALVRPLGRCE